MGLRIIRARSIAAADHLRDYLLPDIDGVLSKDDLVANLKNWLTYASEQTMLLMCFNGDKLEAFGLAAAPQVGDFILIDQVWASPLAQRANIVDKFFDIVKVWAKNLGRHKLRMETMRDPHSITRKFGFKEISTTMEFALEDNELLEEIGDTDGNIKQTKDDEQPHEPAEGDQRRDHELADGEAGSGSDSAAGESTGTVQPSVRHGEQLGSEHAEQSANKGSAEHSERSIRVD